LLARNTLEIALGRLGGVGGAAGDVTVKAGGAIDTSGDSSHGVFAQSIGGGGGASGAVSLGGQVTTGPGDTAQAWAGNLAVGLVGGEGATGGDVTVDADATIVTRGDRSRGVFAQSI